MAQINPNLVLLDYDKPETWVNRPAPADVSAIQHELTRIGGVIPAGYGEMSGQPHFIIVWGQEYKCWLNGKMRLMFDDENIDAQHLPNHFAVTEQVYRRAIHWYLAAEKKRNEALMNCNWENAQKFPDFAEYLRDKESTLDYFRLPSEADPKTIGAIMPDGYRYLCGLWSYQEIGKQAFFVVQWESPEMLGEEKNWNDNRFDFVYLPETDSDENLIDVLGPYPRHGQYSLPILRIADKIADGVYRYRQPTVENVIVPMQQLLHIRGRLSQNEKSPEHQQKLRIEKFRRDFAKTRKNHQKDFSYRFKQAKPVGGGNPTNVPTVEVKPGRNKQGKGRKIEL